MPHVTGEAFLTELGRARGAALAHALTDLDFADPAKRFGPTGGARHIATIIKAIRAERPGRCLLLDGGDARQGAWINLQTKAADMVSVEKALGCDASVGDWAALSLYGHRQSAQDVSGLGLRHQGGEDRRARARD